MYQNMVLREVASPGVKKVNQHSGTTSVDVVMVVASPGVLV